MVYVQKRPRKSSWSSSVSKVPGFRIVVCTQYGLRVLVCISIVCRKMSNLVQLSLKKMGALDDLWILLPTLKSLILHTEIHRCSHPPNINHPKQWTPTEQFYTIFAFNQGSLWLVFEII